MPLPPNPPIIIYTRDPSLERRVTGFLHDYGNVHAIGDLPSLSIALNQFTPAIVLTDLLAREYPVVITQTYDSSASSVVIGLGDERSAPGIEALDAGVVAIERRDCPRNRLQNLCHLGSLHISQRCEIETLRGHVDRCSQRPAQNGPSRRVFETLTSTLKLVANQTSSSGPVVEHCLQRLQEELALGSAGVFLADGSGDFSLSYGNRCPKAVASLQISHLDPLVSWLRANPAPVRRNIPAGEFSAAEERLASIALNTFLAEAIFPLHGNGDLSGWLFIGKSSFGSSVLHEFFPEVSSVADALSRVLVPEEKPEPEPAQYNEIASVGEAVLEALQEGIIIFGSDSKVRWLNSSAASFLGLPPSELLGSPCSMLGVASCTSLGSIERRTSEVFEWQWREPRTSLLLDVEAHVVRGDPGAPSRNHSFFVLRPSSSPVTKGVENRPEPDPSTADQSVFRDDTERNAFPPEPRVVGDRISTRIRQPLVAINTFVQLLNERYHDESFRNDFATLVSGEISKLASLTEDLDGEPSGRTLERPTLESIGARPSNPPRNERKTPRESVPIRQALSEAAELAANESGIDLDKISTGKTTNFSIQGESRNEIVSAIAPIFGYLSSQVDDPQNLTIDVDISPVQNGDSWWLCEFRSLPSMCLTEATFLQRIQVPETVPYPHIASSPPRVEWSRVEDSLSCLGARAETRSDSSSTLIKVYFPRD